MIFTEFYPIPNIKEVLAMGMSKRMLDEYLQELYQKREEYLQTGYLPEEDIEELREWGLEEDDGEDIPPPSSGPSL